MWRIWPFRQWQTGDSRIDEKYSTFPSVLQTIRNEFDFLLKRISLVEQFVCIEDELCIDEIQQPVSQ